MRRANGEIVASLSALGAYFSSVLPGVRGELRRWRREAETISDPELRRQALAGLEEKAENVEAVAVFAILAPRRNRAAALRTIVPLQVATDYLDNLEELGMVVSERSDDYLSRLQQTWRARLSDLPAVEPTRRLIEQAVTRCRAGQDRTHAAEHGRPADLESWARRLPAPPDYRWWELAAGASSSVAAHALIAAAATPGTTARQAEALAATYHPAVGALTVLLDDLVDRQRDHVTGSHNYTGYYADAEDAAERIAAIARHAQEEQASLLNRRRHTAILAGVAGYYLSQPRTEEDALGDAVAAGLEATLGPAVGLIAAAMAARRRLGAS